MLYRPDAYDLATARQEELRRERAEDRLIRVARKARYIRSGDGYRFVPAGQSLFAESPEPSPRAA